MLQDAFGRTIDTLRISVTDRCNFRCRYCMPPDGVAWVPSEQILSFEQIERVARCFLSLGGKRLRLTGGEPLVRRELDGLIARLVRLPGLQDLSLTTNGYFLVEQVAALKAAGLRRINISLDSLNPLRFEWICLTNAMTKVWSGFELACTLGFRIKLNAVALRGITEHDVLEMVELATDRGIDLRFIEFMPLCGSGWKPDLWFPLATIREWINKRWKLRPLARTTSPARLYRVGGRPGRVGFIESLTQPFCDRCSRIRLTPIGRIRPCLFSTTEYDLMPYLDDDAALARQLVAAVAGKPAGHGGQGLTEWKSNVLPLIQNVGG